MWCGQNTEKAEKPFRFSAFHYSMMYFAGELPVKAGG